MTNPRHSQPHRFLARLLLPVALAIAAFMPAHADEPAPYEHTARHEVDFMQHTIDHHLQGVRMSELCMQRATTPELVELCTTMSTAHRAESEQLQTWLEEWYGETHESHLAEPQQDLLTQLEMASNGEFERNYLTQMIPHHMTGIKKAAECEVQFHHGELLDLCATSIAAQAQELRSMRNLLCEAYGVCSLELRENPFADSPTDRTDDAETTADDQA